jgi:hypothetical protein
MLFPSGFPTKILTEGEKGRMEEKEKRIGEGRKKREHVVRKK